MNTPHLPQPDHSNSGQQPAGYQPAPGWAPQPPAPKKKRKLGKILAITAAGLIGVGVVSSMTGGSDKAEAEDKPAATATATADKPADKGKDSPVTSSGNKANAPEKDVTIGAFEATDHGYGFKEGKATLTVTNHSSKKSDYAVTVEFLDKDGNRIAEEFAGTEALAPGQTSKETIGRLVESEKVDQVVELKVTEVERFSSEW